MSQRIDGPYSIAIAENEIKTGLSNKILKFFVLFSNFAF